ncbi:Hypothetical_protein [Hexamita inflata]|uniref:Hypothetical_protein n=1 Tax=Hexamita inflata TaxID=28002 RepID=A0ABP1HWP8_9EUKA
MTQFRQMLNASELTLLPACTPVVSVSAYLQLRVFKQARQSSGGQSKCDSVKEKSEVVYILFFIFQYIEQHNCKNLIQSFIYNCVYTFHFQMESLNCKREHQLENYTNGLVIQMCILSYTTRKENIESYLAPEISINFVLKIITVFSGSGHI